MADTDKTREEISAYNREYYAKNKSKLQKDRAERYNSDRDYRNQVKARSRRSYHVQKKAENKTLGYTLKKKDGTTLYTITYAAQVTGRKASTIRSFERTGVIPPVSNKDSRGWRLYTDYQIGLLSTAFKYYSDRLWTIPNVKEYLYKHWNKEVTNGN